MKDISPAGPTLEQKTYYPIGMNDITIAFPAAEVKGAIDILPHLYDKPNPDKFAPGQPRAALDNEAFIYPDAEFVINTAIFNDAKLARGENKAPKPDAREFQEFGLIGMRIDPCANDIQTKGDDKMCAKVMRLIWQPLHRFDDEQPFDGVDRTFHTIYSLTEDELKAVLATLSKMHADGAVGTFDLPLMTIHPVMQEEGVNGQYFKGALGLVHRYARASKLIGVAMMRTVTEGWVMLQGPIVDKKLKLSPIPTIDRAKWSKMNPDIQLRGFHHPGDPGKDLLMPTSTSNFSFTNPNSKLKDDERRVSINNPLIHNALNIDCMSCHHVDGNNDKEGLLKGAYASKNWNLKTFNTGGARGAGWNFHMFTYNGQRFIGQRVVNETANVLDFLVSRSYLKPLPASPNPRKYQEPAFTVESVSAQIVSKFNGMNIVQQYSNGEKGPYELRPVDKNNIEKIIAQKILYSKDTYALKELNCLSASKDFKSLINSDCNQSDQQLITFFKNSDNTYRIRFAKSANQCLSAANGNTKDHVPLVVEACSETDVRQKFLLLDVE